MAIVALYLGNNIAESQLSGVLMFDEMSVRKSLHVRESDMKVVGFLYVLVGKFGQDPLEGAVTTLKYRDDTHTQRRMADFPELQRRLLERIGGLGFETYTGAPMRVRYRPSPEQDSGSGDDGEEACALEALVSTPRDHPFAESPTASVHSVCPYHRDHRG
ncbi:hypothetical protein MRX96_048056 [Rhipicephalus microplus]